jgi:hypothetical protein
VSTEPASGKTRKRSASKTPNRQDALKVKVTLYLPGDLEKRFAVHAIHSGLDRSELFAEMVRQHCRRYVVSDRLKSPGDEAGGEEQETDAA